MYLYDFSPIATLNKILVIRGGDALSLSKKKNPIPQKNPGDQTNILMFNLDPTRRTERRKAYWYNSNSIVLYQKMNRSFFRWVTEYFRSNHDPCFMSTWTSFDTWNMRSKIQNINSSCAFWLNNYGQLALGMGSWVGLALIGLLEPRTQLSWLIISIFFKFASVMSLTLSAYVYCMIFLRG